MSDVDRILAAYRLRDAIVEMTARYGSSRQKAAYADRRARDGEDGAKKHWERHHRAARRQFAAIQRLASAAAKLTAGGAS